MLGGHVYFRTKAMQNGGPFRCHNCNKKLISKVHGKLKLTLTCPRCKTFIMLIMNEEVPFLKEEGFDESAGVSADKQKSIDATS